MSIGDEEARFCAARLHEARLSATAIEPLSERLAHLDEVAAYLIQRRVIALAGRRRVGYKLGFTSARMRQQMGVDSPNYGVLLEGTQVVGATEFRRFIHPLVEPEIAVTLHKELTGPGVAADRVRDAVRTVHAALEVVDSRYIDYRFRAVDNIADNSSAAAYAIGEGISIDEVPDLVTLQARLLCNDVLVAKGTGGAALGDPLAAVAWLANRLAAEGVSLAAGSVILTGGLTEAYPVSAGDTYRIVTESLGRTAIAFSDTPRP